MTPYRVFVAADIVTVLRGMRDRERQAALGCICAVPPGAV